MWEMVGPYIKKYILAFCCKVVGHPASKECGNVYAEEFVISVCCVLEQRVLHVAHMFGL